MASRRYTIANPDPDPADAIEDLEKLVQKHRYQVTEIQSGPNPLVRSTSLPTKVLSFEDIPFDLKFELSLFRSKSETSLADIVFDPLRLSEVKSLSELDLSSLKLEENLLFEETKPKTNLHIKS